MGLAILLALASIATILLLQQFRYDPERFRLGIPPGTVSPGIAPGQALRLPPAAVAVTPPERFDAALLSDKIDGRAELYLSAGFVVLDCRRFAASVSDPDVVEACVYDLGDARNAYAVWSQQRRAGAPDAGLGPHSYATQSGLFLAAGRFYVEVLATRGGPAALALARAFATDFAAANAADGTGGAMAEASRLPADGKVPGSDTLLNTSAFGFDRLDRITLARYRRGDKEATAFLSARDDEAGARSLADAWREALLAQGAQPAPAPAGIPGAWALDAAGWTEIAFARGRFLAGVHEAESREVADALATALWKALEGDPP